MIETSKLMNSASETEHFTSGEIIISENDTEYGKMYIILSGTVDVYKNYKQPGEVKVGTLKTGEFFGEMSLFSDRARSATVVAACDVKVLAVGQNNALEFFRNEPEATFSLIQTLCARIGDTNTYMADNTVKYENNMNSLSMEKEKFKTASNTDALTGIFNRRYFMDASAEILSNTFAHKLNAYVTLIDLDFFKKVNDTYGHQAGDETLKTAAKTISSTLRESDLFARYGGEEFVALLTGVNDESVLTLVDRIRLNIQKTQITFENMQINITASFGIAQVISPDEFETAIAHADEALYKAKENGRNRAVLYT